MLIRKRNESGEGKGGEGEVFDRSKKTLRSPVVEKEKG